MFPVIDVHPVKCECGAYQGNSIGTGQGIYNMHIQNNMPVRQGENHAVDDPADHQDPLDIVDATSRTLAVLRKIRDRVGINTSSSANLFVCDGHNLVATRFTFDFGCYSDSFSEPELTYLSLWFTFGRDYGFHDGEWKMVGGAGHSDSVIVSSEPLTCEISTWLEIPEYNSLYVTSENGRRVANTIELNV